MEDREQFILPEDVTFAKMVEEVKVYDSENDINAKIQVQNKLFFFLICLTYHIFEFSLTIYFKSNIGKYSCKA